MNRNFGALALVSALVSIPVQAAPKTAPAKPAAQTAPVARSTSIGVGQGDFEANIFAVLQSPDEGDDTTFIGAGLGYYYTDNVVLNASLFALETGGTKFGALGLGADYLFSAFQPQMISTPLVPFVGADYALNIGDDDETDFIELHGGLKQFIGERISVNYELQRLMATKSEFDDLNSTNFVVEVGFYF